MSEVKTESALLDLADRCEKAAYLDRTLDRAIALATGWTVLMVQKDEWLVPPSGSSISATPTSAPRYTASLDAAMTLVPEGFVHAIWYPPEGIKVQMWHTGRNYCGFGVDVPEAVAPTYALAICAAALRARHLAT